MVIETSVMANLFDTSRKTGFGMSSDGDARILNDVGAFGYSPISSIIAWNKTFAVADSGNCDGIGATTGVLKDSGQNFQSTVLVGMICENTTSDPREYTEVTGVTSDTALTVTDDIFDDGDDYVIYKVQALPDGWLECDGTVINDTDSVFHGETLPDLNNTTMRTLIGSNGSGVIGGSTSHAHNFGSSHQGQSGSGTQIQDPPTQTVNHMPPYMSVVWIIRIK